MDGSIAPFLVTSGAGAVAIASLLWALRVTDGARGSIKRWKERADELEDKVSRADSIFGAHPGAVLIWEDAQGSVEEGDWGQPRAYGSSLALGSLLRFSDGSMAADPSVRILHGLASFEARDAAGRPARLAPALARLRRDGTPFSLRISTPNGVFVEIDGRTAGPRAVIWIVDSSVKGAEESGAQGILVEAHRRIAQDPVVFLEMVDDASFLCWLVSSGGRLEWANEAYVRALEVKSLEQAISRNAMIDSAAVEQARRTIDLAEPTSEIRHIVVAGARRAFRVVMTPASGGAAGMAFDITDEEDLRERFLQHSRAHEKTLDHLDEGVAVFDGDKRLVFHNQAFEAMWELDKAFLAEKPTHAQWLDRLKADRKLPAHANYAEWRAVELAYYQQVSQSPPEPWVLEDGRTLSIARQPHPMGGLLLVFSDVTKETELRGQYNALLKVQQAALDKLHEGVVVFSSDGRLRLHNSAFASMWSVPADALATGADFDRIAHHLHALVHDSSIWAGIKARITDPSPTARQEHRGDLKRSDGTIVSFLVRPLPDGATLVAFLDITASKRVEEALRDRAEAYEAADRLKTEFVQNVSVQLRDPLQTIAGFGEMLAQRMSGPLNDRQAEQIGIVVQAAGHLSRLVDDVLDLAMIEANKIELDYSDVEIAAVLEDAARLATTSAKDTEVAISVVCGESVGVLRGDEKRIRQMLMNLMSNALRHTKAGDRIEIGAERGEEALRIWVRDTGDGMPYDAQAQAFDHFVSGDRMGAGLGLALVRSFAELHGGWVALKSAPNEGAMVSIFLPTRGDMRIAAE